MTAQQLQEFVQEVIAFLKSIDKVLPNKVSEELITFLQGIESHPWLVEMVLNALESTTQPAQPVKSNFLKRSS